MARHRKQTAVQRTLTMAAVGSVMGAATIAGAPSALAATGEFPTAAGPPGGWGPVIACESGGNPAAQNPHSTASGLFQFLDTSWIAYGGGRYAQRAKDATPEQQLEIANLAYAQSGLSPWAASRSCWQGKTSGPAAAELALKPVPAVPAPATTTAPAPAAGGKHASGLEAVKPALPAGPKHAADTGRRTVVAGDTLSQIAVAAGQGDWHQLYERNFAVVGSNPDLIFPGQVLDLVG